MAIVDDKWFEVWFEEGYTAEPGYLVVVCSDKAISEDIYIKDPCSQQILYKASNYDLIRDWLLEDGFYEVRGREFKDLPEPGPLD